MSKIRNTFPKNIFYIEIVGSWAQIIQLGFGLKAQVEDKGPSEDG